MSEVVTNQNSYNKKREAITSDFLKIEPRFKQLRHSHLRHIEYNIKSSQEYSQRLKLKNRKIPLDAVYKDPSIAQLTQNKAIINESLNRVPYVTFNNERKIVVLNYSFNKNELFVPQKQLVEQEKSIVSLKDHHVIYKEFVSFQKEIKRITKTESTFIIALETRESVQAVQDKLLQQNIKALDEKEKFYYDLIENIEKKRSIPTISDKTLLKPKQKENYIGYHRGILQGFLNQTIPPVSPSPQYLNHLQFIQIMDPNFLRRNNVVDSLTYPQQNQNNQQRKKNNKIETPKISAATPSFRRKRLLSQGQFNQDSNTSQNQNKIAAQHRAQNEEVIYEKKKNGSNSQFSLMRSPKQVQFKEQNMQQKQKKLIQKVSSSQQFERVDFDQQSDQQSNESFDISKKNQHKLKASKSSESFKDILHFGEQTIDDKRESLLSEDANSTSTQQVDTSECNFTPKITLLQMEMNQNQDDTESEHEDEECNKEKFHPQTTDSFRPKNYQKLEQIDDLEI